MSQVSLFLFRCLLSFKKCHLIMFKIIDRSRCHNIHKSNYSVLEITPFRVQLNLDWWYMVQCDVHLGHNVTLYSGTKRAFMCPKVKKQKNLITVQTVADPLVNIGQGAHLRNKFLEICCMKHKTFIWCNISINFNRTVHTMKQGTHVSRNVFHKTH